MSFVLKLWQSLVLKLSHLWLFLKRCRPRLIPCYFDAKTRGEVLKETHAERAYSLEQRRKLFPEMDRMRSPAGHLGEG